jgi:hypothetical protein
MGELPAALSRLDIMAYEFIESQLLLAIALVAFLFFLTKDHSGSLRQKLGGCERSLNSEVQRQHETRAI